MAANTRVASARVADKFDEFFKNRSKFEAAGGRAADQQDAETIAAAQRMAGPAALLMLRQIGLDETMTEGSFSLLDHACGTGVVADVVQGLVPRDVLERSTVLSADSAPQCVQMVQSRIEREGWVGCEAKVLDIQKTDLPDASFSHITVNFGFHVFKDPGSALKDCIRTLKPGGTLAFTSPCGANKLPFEEDLTGAFAALPFEAPPFPTWPRQLHDQGNYADVAWVRQKLEEGEGLEDVRVEMHQREMTIEGADDYLLRYGAVIGMSIAMNWPEELRAAHPLDEVQPLVREYLIKAHGGKSWKQPYDIVLASGKKKTA